MWTSVGIIVTILLALLFIFYYYFIHLFLRIVVSEDRRRKYVWERCHYSFYQNHKTAGKPQRHNKPLTKINWNPLFLLKNFVKITVTCVFCHKVGWMFSESRVRFYNPEIETHCTTCFWEICCPRNWVSWVALGKKHQIKMIQGVWHARDTHCLLTDNWICAIQCKNHL